MAEAAETSHVVLLVEDITLEAAAPSSQMLLTERLSTAGRLAAGVAHELNNPLVDHRGLRVSRAGGAAATPP